MKISVFGHKGMLGEAVCNKLLEYGHTPIASYGYHIADRIDVMRITDRTDGGVINCLGKIPQRCDNPAEMIYSNSIIPRMIASTYEGPIVHVSTDKVFSGKHLGKAYYTTNSPTPDTIYGRSKLLGEVNAYNVTNVRTSFIGMKHGLLRWLIDNNGNNIDGYVNAIWSGSYVEEVAEGLVNILITGGFGNVEHLATRNPISKYDLLVHLVRFLKLDIGVRAVEEPYQNFHLQGTVLLKSVTELT